MIKAKTLYILTTSGELEKILNRVEQSRKKGFPRRAFIEETIYGKGWNGQGYPFDTHCEIMVGYAKELFENGKEISIEIEPIEVKHPTTFKLSVSKKTNNKNKKLTSVLLTILPRSGKLGNKN